MMNQKGYLYLCVLPAVFLCMAGVLQGSSMTGPEGWEEQPLVSGKDVREFLQLPYTENEHEPLEPVDLMTLNRFPGVEGFTLKEEIDVLPEDVGVIFFLYDTLGNEFRVWVFKPESVNAGCDQILRDLFVRYSLWSCIIEEHQPELYANMYTVRNTLRSRLMTLFLDRLLMVAVSLENRESQTAKNILNENIQIITNAVCRFFNASYKPVEPSPSEAAPEAMAPPPADTAGGMPAKPDISIAPDYYTNLVRKLKADDRKGRREYFELAEIHYYGRLNVPKNDRFALMYYRQAANNPEKTEGEDPLYVLYVSGVSAERHRYGDIDGMALIREAADKGLAEAQADLAFRYMKGWGVEADFEQAGRYAQLAAAQGNMRGKAIWGAYLMNLKNDVDGGIALIREAAEAGDAGGEYMLFRCLYYGKGVPRDTEQGLKLLKNAAARGLPDAVDKLEIMRNQHPDNEALF